MAAFMLLLMKCRILFERHQLFCWWSFSVPGSHIAFRCSAVFKIKGFTYWRPSGDSWRVLEWGLGGVVDLSEATPEQEVPKVGGRQVGARKELRLHLRKTLLFLGALWGKGPRMPPCR